MHAVGFLWQEQSSRSQGPFIKALEMWLRCLSPHVTVAAVRWGIWSNHTDESAGEAAPLLSMAPPQSPHFKPGGTTMLFIQLHTPAIPPPQPPTQLLS